MNDSRVPIARPAAPVGPKLLIALVVLLALTLLTGMYLGRHSVYRAMEADPQSVRRMQSQLSELTKKLETVRGDLQMQRTRHEVDSRALEMVRREMAAEKEHTADLEEDLRFYRSLIAPEDSATGLSLRQPELVAEGTPRRFKYRFIIQQRARKHQEVEGSLSVAVVGVEGGKQVSYPLSKLSDEMKDSAVALHFRYFQAIEGDLVLPEGLEPTGLEVVANASKPRETEVSKQFPWELQESFTNVGK